MSTQHRDGAVHEAQTQRQHVRVQVPGVVEFKAGDERIKAKLVDVSAGGFSFMPSKHAPRAGQSYRGSLIFNVDGIALAVSAPFVVRNTGPDGRIGCAFQELGEKEISVLRHLISSHLNGDLASAGDVLRSAGRNNFTRPRGNERAGERSGSRLGALVMTACFVFAGFFAFAFTAKHLSRLLFVTEATAGKIAGTVYTVEMPRDGTFHSLVPPDGMVKKGAAIASFDSPVIDLLRSEAMGPSLNAEQLQKMMSMSIKGTITSPCDCQVQTQHVANDQYVARGQAVMELMPMQVQPYVVARFRSDQAAAIEQGSLVHFRVNGESKKRSGTVRAIRAAGQGDSVDADVIATIEPADPIPAKLFNRPAVVTSGEMPSIADLSILLGGTANAAESINESKQ